ncbi:MAG: hypothetical protein JO235_12810 [Chroococcidiopsidaceae cyanobacterium CP_BM_RX_35]|nr:hypothetical protein [Chroococcidiopsidaceae cyanobacterium CP_BM_RX_35]MBV9384908.1 hypothetical protein [Chroococcidiopsidaceae cyanobacterium CP_BM_ER_R8_30]
MGRPPNGTNTFVLILDDPDAPDQSFTHWVVYNLPVHTRELPEGITNLPCLTAECREKIVSIS